MTDPVSIPLWLFLVLIGLGILAVLDRMLLPSVRWFLRRKVNRLLDEIGHRLDLYADMLNILNLRTPTTYGQNDGQNFGVETGWMEPFRVRLGLNYKF